MSFAQEMKDFMAGYLAVREMGQRKRETDLNEKKVNADIAYQEGKLALDKEELALRARAASTRAAAGSAGRKPTAAETKAAKAAEETAANNLADSVVIPPLGAETDLYPGSPDVAPQDGSGRYELTPGFQQGGMVEEPDALGVKRMAVPMESPGDYIRPAPKPTALPPAAPKPAPVAAPKPVTEAVPVTPERLKPITPERLKPVTPERTKLPAHHPTTIFLNSAGKVAGEVGEMFLLAEQQNGQAVGAPDGVSAEELATIMNTIDSEGQLTAAQRATAAFVAPYLTMKDPQKKFKLTVGVLQRLKEESQILGSLIPEALRNGHVREAVTLMNDAAARFPSEHQITVTQIPQGFAYEIRDLKDNVVDTGNLTPEQFLEMSGKVADGSAFVEGFTRFYNENKKTGGSYSVALDNVGGAYNDVSMALDRYNEVNASDAPYEEKKAAYDALMAAKEALSLGETDARRLGRMGDKPRDEAMIASDLRSSRQEDKSRAIPDAPVGAPAAPAPAPTPQGNEEIPLAPAKEQRVVGQKYRNAKGEVAIWQGSGWKKAE